MNLLYAARGTFDRNFDGEGMTWVNYLLWSKLNHLTELVSLDGMLNEDLVEPDYDDEYDWNYIHVQGEWQSGFYTSLEYVLKRMKQRDKFNLMAVLIEPSNDCSQIEVQGFEFMGYELLDQGFGNSALSNCGGFDETFLPNDLNDKGLIDNFTNAYDIRKRLLENNPEEHHADTNVIAVWRHKSIGR